MINAVGGLSQSFSYDFSKKNAGLIGSYKIGVQLPQNAIIHYVDTFCSTTVVSAGAALLSIGTSNTTNLIFGPVNYNLFIANIFPVSVVSAGIMDSSLDIVLTISGAQITAGIFKGFIHYYFPQ